MTFILGSSKLSYDYFGTYSRRHDLAVAEAPVVGDTSLLGEATPGSFSLCEEQKTIKIHIEAT